MRRISLKAIGFLLGMLVSTAVFAQDGGGQGLFAVGSGLAMGLGALGGAIGLGLAASAALGGMARNPSSKDQVFTPMVLVLALVEFQAIMAFIIAVLWFGK